MEILGIIGAFAALASVVVGIGSAVSQGINAEKNYKQQQELLQYQKDVQNKTWEREDTGMQRAMSDYEAAGVNPLLALGNPYGSGSVVETSAPQKKNIDFSGIQSALQGLENPYKFENEYLDYQAKKKQNEQLILQNEQLTTANAERELALEVARYNFEWYKNNKLPTNASGLPKQFSEGKEMLKGFIPSNRSPEMEESLINHLEQNDLPVSDNPIMNYVLAEATEGKSKKQLEMSAYAQKSHRKYMWNKIKDSFAMKRKDYKAKYSKKF